MNNARLYGALAAYQWLAGLCDASTGLLLIFAPVWTLHLMGIHHIPARSEYVSFVGVFVLAVGLSYWLAAGRPLNARNAALWRAVWSVTALVRSLVALFLTAEILTDRMEAAWFSVAFTDGLMAALQWMGLARGWLAVED